MKAASHATIWHIEQLFQAALYLEWHPSWDKFLRSVHCTLDHRPIWAVLRRILVHPSQTWSTEVYHFCLSKIGFDALLFVQHKKHWHLDCDVAQSPTMDNNGCTYQSSRRNSYRPSCMLHYSYNTAVHHLNPIWSLNSRSIRDQYRRISVHSRCEANLGTVLSKCRNISTL